MLPATGRGLGEGRGDGGAGPRRLDDLVNDADLDGPLQAAGEPVVLVCELLLDGRAMPTFEDEMRQEFAVAARVVQRPDIVEGVRAVIIDKDHAPRWDPATPEAVSDHMIDRIFAPLPADEEWNPA